MHNKQWMFIFISIFLPMYPIHHKTAHIVIGFAAISSACVQYKAQTFFAERMHSVLCGVANVGLLYGLHSLLYTCTPEGRLKKASELIDEINGHSLARVSLEDDKLFFDMLYDVYLTDDLPLIGAYNHLIDLLSRVHYALALINHASSEIGKDTLLQEKCDVLLFRSRTVFNNIASAIKRIRAHKDYLPQLRIYKEFIADDSCASGNGKIASLHAQLTYMQKKSVLSKWMKIFE